MPAPLTAAAINCSLSARGRASSTDAMIAVLSGHFEAHGVTVADPIRIAAHKVRWGVTSNEGSDDDWPKIREAILAADILIFGTPIWMGQPSSVAKLVMERMDAFLSETDDRGRMPSYSKVAVAAIVGNEDGAHHVSSQIFQALNDVGWTIPAVGACYWVGEAMGSIDFRDLKETPEKVSETAAMVAANAAHLARLLREAPYPG